MKDYAETFIGVPKTEILQGKEEQMTSEKKGGHQNCHFLSKRGINFNRVITLDRNQKGN
ncbi:hypothetical protein [Methanosarcina acetivorans]|uniref:hypothetical protein n=1 Tax=Methanosarcina acetivorans TaxID=2214 RepID=UPI0012FF18D8|nr:hypothetical protein [Methanosarcina acetivorans]